MIGIVKKKLGADCTGGIRCDIYSAYLKAKGYKNLFTLERGVANYFRTEGGEHWKGSMFVFDARMAVSPAGGEEGNYFVIFF